MAVPHLERSIKATAVTMEVLLHPGWMEKKGRQSVIRDYLNRLGVQFRLKIMIVVILLRPLWKYKIQLRIKSVKYCIL